MSAATPPTGETSTEATSSGGLRPEYPLRTARLDLRPHRVDDLDDLLAFHSRPEVVRYVPWPVRDRAQTREALERKLHQDVLTAPGQWLVLAVELRETATVIGEVLLKWDSDTDRRGELGFALHSDHHGRGLAGEAAREVLRLGFEQLGLHKITAVCVDGNEDSVRLLRRLGMRQEAHLRRHVLFKGAWVDQLVFGLLAQEWREQADREVLTAAVHTFLAAFTSGPGTDERIAALRRLLLPQAVVVRTGGGEPLVLDVDGFLAPRAAMLTDGTLTGFHEWELAGRLDVFGDVAAYVGSYAKEGVHLGTPTSGRGVKTLHFVRTGAGWRISAVAWDDEREGLELPPDPPGPAAG